MKKLGILFLAGALTLGLAACGGADGRNNGSKTRGIN